MGVAVVVEDVTDDVEALVAEVPALVWYAATPSTATAAAPATPKDAVSFLRRRSARSRSATVMRRFGAGITGPPAAGPHGLATRCERTEPGARMRSTPRRSVSTVRGMFTRESGSSTHVDGDFVDAESVPLCDHQQLGVEEPSLVADRGQQVSRDLGTDGLEAALRIAKARVQDGTQEKVVRARYDLTLERSRLTRAPGASLLPMLISLLPERSGATRAPQRVE